ncbi:hypothetical protein [Streptomyces pratensis]
MLVGAGTLRVDNPRLLVTRSSCVPPGSQQVYPLKVHHYRPR